jgi:hypothetical protein
MITTTLAERPAKFSTEYRLGLRYFGSNCSWQLWTALRKGRGIDNHFGGLMLVDAPLLTAKFCHNKS